jgi:hypothetical protein
MRLSFVGTRFSEAQLSRPGCLLSVTVQLPNGPINAIVSTVTCDRPKRKEGRAKWIMIVGGAIHQISDRDQARLGAYLIKLAAEQSSLVLEQS